MTTLIVGDQLHLVDLCNIFVSLKLECIIRSSQRSYDGHTMSFIGNMNYNYIARDSLFVLQLKVGFSD